MMAGKLPPAIAAGCSVVLKPAETVCLSVLEFIREVEDILPKGLVNIVTGYGADVGESLVTHPAIRKVAFTGSVPTARRIFQYALLYDETQVKFQPIRRRTASISSIGARATTAYDTSWFAICASRPSM